MSTILGIDDTQITNIVGLEVEIVTASGTLLSGVIYSFFRPKNLLFLFQILRSENGLPTNNLVCVSISKIASIKITKGEVSSAKYNEVFNEILKPNFNLLLEKERMNLEKNTLLVRSDKSNFLYKTYQKGYAIYDKLSKMYCCRFTGTKITFDELDAYIDVPFNLKDIHSENERTKDQLTKVIDQCLQNIK